MRSPVPPEQESLRELASRCIDNGKSYLKAEVTLAKETVASRTRQAVPAVGWFAAALLLLQAGLTVLIASLGCLLALWLGWPGGMALGAVVGLLAAGLCAWLGVRAIKGIGS